MVLDLKIAPIPETTTLSTIDQILPPPPPLLPPPPPSPHALVITSVAVEAEDPSTTTAPTVAADISSPLVLFTTGASSGIG